MAIGLSDSAKVKAMDHISRRLGSNQPLHKGSPFSNRESARDMREASSSRDYRFAARTVVLLVSPN
jgi:hypothetical protein